MNRKLIVGRLCASIVFALSSCGSANFEGQKTGKPTPVPGVAPQNPDDMTALTWFWQCDSDPATEPKMNEGEVILRGKGDHEFDQRAFDKGLPIAFSGRICPPVKYPRDIVFVIDVSGSMDDTQYGNDTMSAGTCGRMEAVKAIMSDITSQGGTSKFAVVTFSSAGDRNDHSSALFSSSDLMFDDLKSQSGLASAAAAICAVSGNTWYKSGLDEARNLLLSGRAGAMKEIYMISDGVPTTGYEGVGEAESLRTTGVAIDGTNHPVQIATVMIGSSSGTSLMALASSDKEGNKLHAEKVKAKDLASTLSKLAANEIDDGYISYRPIGGDTWSQIPLRDNMKGYDFSIPAIKLTTADAPQGLEVKFEYHDQHNNVYSSGGNIKWKATKTKK